MVKICCFHTAKSNVALYDEAALNLCKLNDIAACDLEITHIIRPDLLECAEQNCDIPNTLAATADAMLVAAKNVDAILLTCSTLGAAVTFAKEQSKNLFFRSDEELARQAAKLQGKIAAFCSVKSTIKATQQIFDAQNFGKENSFDLILINGAWDLFKTGEFQQYNALVAKAANESLKGEYQNIVLVQSSMMKAAKQINHSTVLTAPEASLKAVMQQLLKIN